MPRNKNTFPLLATGAALILVGGFAIYSYEHSSHNTAFSSTTQPSSHPSSLVTEQNGAKCHMVGVLPDSACTPGSVDPTVTQANINQTICVSGYTKTVRPAASYTNKLKAQQMIAYGFTDDIRAHEEDHLVSLELGGAPSDPLNLWPEPGNSPNPKDKIENFLHAAVCAGHISLRDAQIRIETDWTTAEQGL